MATPKRMANGRWKIEIEVGATREARRFDTARAATAWAAKRSTELRADARGQGGVGRTLRDALRRYAVEVSPGKRGARSELIRLAAFERQAGMPTLLPLADVTTAHFAAWRDARLRVNGPGAVLRDITLLNAVLETARREWLWLGSNPLRDMRRPKKPPHRARLLAGHEVRAMLRALGHRRQPDLAGGRVASVSQAVAIALLLALATGMRAGELTGLRWADVQGPVAVLHTSKTGRGRRVPLSSVALRLLGRLRGWDDDLVLAVSARVLDALFRRARQRAGLDGFTFHDARHSAATRLAQRLSPYDLARSFGWTNLGQAMTYYNASAEDIARRLG